MPRFIASDKITSEALFNSRRKFFKESLSLASAAALVAACGPKSNGKVQPTETIDSSLITQSNQDELGNALTQYSQITEYTNFYEFSTDKAEPARLSKSFKTKPWSVQIGGLVRAPQILTMEQILSLFDQEERVYRLRCVEAWSMVVPWLGFPLKKILDLVEPNSDAKFVRFESFFDPEQMPGQKNPFFPWPYIEGLRLDEANHDLTILATGIYGKPLTPQNGAPIRLVVPWKYGFKSIKSIVRIDLVAEMPTSLWMAAGPNEYGFFANVNPNVHHPRWSQSTEQRIGGKGRIETLMFNGYGDEVAALYEGMDLVKNF